MTIADKLNKILADYPDIKGGLIILLKEDEKGHYMAVEGINYLEIRDCLCMGIHFNEEKETSTWDMEEVEHEGDFFEVEGEKADDLPPFYK